MSYPQNHNLKMADPVIDNKGDIMCFVEKFREQIEKIINENEKKYADSDSDRLKSIIAIYANDCLDIINKAGSVLANEISLLEKAKEDAEGKREIIKLIEKALPA